MIIDMHHHGLPPRALDRILADPEAYGFAGGAQSAEVERLRLWGPFTDLQEQKAELQQAGADGAVLSTVPYLPIYTLSLKQAQHLCRLLNDSLAEWIAGEASFRGMAAVPLQDGPAAAEELRRTSEELHLRGAMIATHIGGTNLDAPHLEPFWEAAEALQVPIFVHPNPADILARERLRSYGLQLHLGVSMEGTVAAASLVMSGVFDRYPRLKVILSHGGGYLSVAFGRLTHAYHYLREASVPPASARPGGQQWRPMPSLGPLISVPATEPPDAYLRRFYYDTVLFHPEPLLNLIRLVGADRVLYGTDYPFNPEFPQAVRAIEALGLAAEESEAILGGTAAKLYGFEGEGR